MPVSATDAIQDALEQGTDLGFEMRPGFTTHWAMGSETLVALGHPEIVHDWAAQFIERHRHFDRPLPQAPIDPADWRQALGDFDRVADWQVLFEAELAERSWNEVLVAWWPRLVFGSSAALTHGLIRTMHAVRGIDRISAGEPSALQLRELATALAYWAGRYVELPASREHRTEGTGLPAVLATVPRLDPDSKISLRDKGFFLHIPEIEGWGDAVDGLAAPADVQAAFSELTLAFAQAQLAHPDIFPIPLVHTTTAPAAMRTMLAYLPEELHGPSFVAAWQSCAALLTSFAQSDPAEIQAAADPGQAPPAPEELTARAIEHADMHTLKLTEACLREYAIRPDDRYLLLPERLIAQLPPFFRGRHARASA
jgi:hypothetical protein